MNEILTRPAGRDRHYLATLPSRLPFRDVLTSMLPPRKTRARAPLRLGLAGGGTDLSPFCDEHGGNVLNCTISLYAHAVVEERQDWLTVFSAEDIEANEATKENIRLWRPSVLEENFRALQRFRQYYEFRDVDVDRYELDGERQVLMV